MIKNLCKVPKCLNKSIGKSEYCRVHTKELESKSEMYLKEMKCKAQY